MAVKKMAASVLERLRQQAQREGISFQNCLQLFCQEDFLRRLGKSHYCENFVLKGGMFLYTLTNFDSRPTRDMDFLMRRLSNDLNRMRETMETICALQTPYDFLNIEVVKTEQIIVSNQYPGVRIKLLGRIENLRIPFSVDIGIDDVIVPEAVLRTITTRLPNAEQPQIYTYSLESTIAEKLDAILQFMELTGRMKDFYDIYYLSGMFDFDGKLLQTAIETTLTHRNHILTAEHISRMEQFSKNPEMEKLWNRYEPVKNAGIPFQNAVDGIFAFLKPVLTAIVSRSVTAEKWQSAARSWVTI